jgi:hypothetical protein
MSTTNLTPTQIHSLISVLNKRFENAMKQKEKIERNGQKIKQEIRGIQRQCPHENTAEDPVMDGPDVKYRTFCTDCGAECQNKG